MLRGDMCIEWNRQTADIIKTLPKSHFHAA